MSNNEIFPLKICRVFDKRFHGMEFYVENKISSDVVVGIVLQKIRIIDDVSFITSEGMIHYTDEISDEMYSELKRFTSEDIIFNKDYYTIGDRYVDISDRKSMMILDSYSSKELKYKKYHGESKTHSFGINEVYNRFVDNNPNSFYHGMTGEAISLFVKIGESRNDEFITKTPIISGEKAYAISNPENDMLNNVLIVNKSTKTSYIIFRVSADNKHVVLVTTDYRRDRHTVSIDELKTDYEIYKFKYGPKRGLMTEKYDISKLMKDESFKYDESVKFFILTLKPEKFPWYHGSFLSSNEYTSEYINISETYSEDENHNVSPSDILEIYPIYEQQDWIDKVLDFFRTRNINSKVKEVVV